MPESTNSQLITYFMQFFMEDWFASIPISICLVATVAVAFDRMVYYSRNQRDIASFIRRMQESLEKNNLDAATSLAKQVGGLIGMMTEEGLRLVKFHSRNFSSAFDISCSLYVRDLEKRLPILATIGATSPFLGLFGTVVGVVVTLKALGESGGGSQAVVIGVAKALIATGYGLIVAIAAVIFNNWFSSRVTAFENDFQMIKLTLMDFLTSQLNSPKVNTPAPISQVASSQQTSGYYQSAPVGASNFPITNHQ